MNSLIFKEYPGDNFESPTWSSDVENYFLAISKVHRIRTMCYSHKWGRHSAELLVCFVDKLCKGCVRSTTRCGGI